MSVELSKFIHPVGLPNKIIKWELQRMTLPSFTQSTYHIFVCILSLFVFLPKNAITAIWPGAWHLSLVHTQCTHMEFNRCTEWEWSGNQVILCMRFWRSVFVCTPWWWSFTNWERLSVTIYEWSHNAQMPFNGFKCKERQEYTYSFVPAYLIFSSLLVSMTVAWNRNSTDDAR